MTPQERARREANTLPIPFGWFGVALSNEVAPGSVHTLTYFDREFVLWRGEDGGLRALDPYCPHLGAHRGHQGKVIGNELQCPFHHWTFDGDGRVTDIPYSPMVPPVLRQPCANKWPIAEAHGVVYAWFHPTGAEPLWPIASIPELDGGEWEKIDHRDWRIGVHIQEITENGIDYAHFRAVHGTKSPPQTEWTIKGYSRESCVVTKMETPRGLVDGSIHVRNTGPGQSFVRFGGITDLLLINLVTPISTDATHLRQIFYIPGAIDAAGRRSAMAVARNVIFQVEQDKPIWEHKRFEPKPILVKGDGPILAYRRQYAQYYVASDATPVVEAPPTANS